MGLADAAIHGIVDSVAFLASDAAYLLLDTDLRIRGANLAYRRATLHNTADIVGEFMFDVFPDNPSVPSARGVERLGHSFERAMVGGAPDRMALQRYDVRDADTGAFVEKSWLPTNTPVRDPDGHTVGVLHHVEDVTRLLVATALERDLLGPAGSRSLMQRIQQDAAERQARSRDLVQRSREAMERMSRRIAIEETDGHIGRGADSGMAGTIPPPEQRRSG